MVVSACIAGQMPCVAARFSEKSFTSEEACYDRMGEVTRSMTKQFALDLELKGKQVTYDVSCMSQKQLQAKFGTLQVDL